MASGNFVAKHMHRFNKASVAENKFRKQKVSPIDNELDENYDILLENTKEEIRDESIDQSHESSEPDVQPHANDY